MYLSRSSRRSSSCAGVSDSSFLGGKFGSMELPNSFFNWKCQNTHLSYNLVTREILDQFTKSELGGCVIHETKNQNQRFCHLWGRGDKSEGGDNIQGAGWWEETKGLVNLVIFWAWHRPYSQYFCTSHKMQLSPNDIISEVIHIVNWYCISFNKGVVTKILYHIWGSEQGGSCYARNFTVQLRPPNRDVAKLPNMQRLYSWYQHHNLTLVAYFDSVRQPEFCHFISTRFENTTMARQVEMAKVKNAHNPNSSARITAPRPKCPHLLMKTVQLSVTQWAVVDAVDMEVEHLKTNQNCRTYSVIPVALPTQTKLSDANLFTSRVTFMWKRPAGGWGRHLPFRTKGFW